MQPEISTAVGILPPEDMMAVRKNCSSPPPLEEGEKTTLYLMMLKMDCPMEQIDLGGINFAKRFLPESASLVENMGTPVSYKSIARPLTDAQVRWFVNAAKKHRICWRDKKTFRRKFGLASDWIILMPLAQIPEIDLGIKVPDEILDGAVEQTLDEISQERARQDQEAAADDSPVEPGPAPAESGQISAEQLQTHLSKSRKK